MVERQRTFEDDGDGAVHRHHVLEAAISLERFAREVFHHHVGLFLAGKSLVNADDVGVIEPPGHRGLGAQQLDQAAGPLGLVLALILETHQLDRHRIGFVRRLRQIDHGRCAAPDFPHDVVFANALRYCLAHSVPQTLLPNLCGKFIAPNSGSVQGGYETRPYAQCQTQHESQAQRL